MRARVKSHTRMRYKGMNDRYAWNRGVIEVPSAEFLSKVNLLKMENPLPPEVANPLLEIVCYVLTFISGVISRWLLGKKSVNRKTDVR